jgi:hypothetical protein
MFGSPQQLLVARSCEKPKQTGPMSLCDLCNRGLACCAGKTPSGLRRLREKKGKEKLKRKCKRNKSKSDESGFCLSRPLVTLVSESGNPNV